MKAQHCCRYLSPDTLVCLGAFQRAHQPPNMAAPEPALAACWRDHLLARLRSGYCFRAILLRCQALTQHGCAGVLWRMPDCDSARLHAPSPGRVSGGSAAPDGPPVRWRYAAFQDAGGWPWASRKGPGSGQGAWGQECLAAGLPPARPTRSRPPSTCPATRCGCRGGAGHYPSLPSSKDLGMSIRLLVLTCPSNLPSPVSSFKWHKAGLCPIYVAPFRFSAGTCNCAS